MRDIVSLRLLTARSTDIRQNVMEVLANLQVKWLDDGAEVKEASSTVPKAIRFGELSFIERKGRTNDALCLCPYR